VNDVVNEAILGHIVDGMLRDDGFSDTGISEDQNRNSSIGVSFNEKVLDRH